MGEVEDEGYENENEAEDGVDVHEDDEDNEGGDRLGASLQFDRDRD